MLIMGRSAHIFAAVAFFFIIISATWFRNPHYYNPFLQTALMHSNSRNFTRTRLSPMKHCGAGHIHKLPPICGAGGCLRSLPGRKTKVILAPMSKETRSKVKSISGWVGLIHVDMIWYLTMAQRHFGIWGSVGEIGVYQGKFTSILANWMDKESGERLFICDVFGAREHMKLNTEAARKDLFQTNMLKFGFSMYSQDEVNNIRVWDDSSLYLSKSVFLDMDLPSFRLFSIDGNHNKPFILLDLLLVSCIIKDGGIIAVDDVMNPKWPGVRASVAEFFMHFGEDILKPLALVNGKLYLVTANWHKKYVTWFKLNGVPIKLKLRQRTDKYLGPIFSYYRT